MITKKTIPVSCNKDCGAGCALTALVENGKLISVSDSAERMPYMKGCIKGYRTAETVYHKDRLLKPLIRSGRRGSGDFREAEWDEALDLIASKMEELRSSDICPSLLRIGGSGSCRGALHNTDSVTKRFLSLFGNYTDTAGNYSSEASSFIKKPVFGTKYVGIDARTLLHSKNIILWGFNPFDTRFDCEVESILLEVSKMGTPITVIDPRKTRTVKNLNARWIPIKPGTDSAFMLSILWILIKKNLIDRSYINKYSSGFDIMEDYILGVSDGIEKSPVWAERICGIDKNEIEEFAISYASFPITSLLPGLSLQRAIGGENADRLGAVLQLATGNTGKMGGSTGSNKWNRLEKPYMKKLPVPENEQVKSIPVYLWADAVLQGKSGGYPSDINFIYNVGGNYIGQGSDTLKTIRAFEKADFSVTHDYFMTKTASYSDVILPVTTFIEREDLISATNNYIFYSGKAIEPVGESKNDYMIFSELSERLGFKEAYTENKSEKDWIDGFLINSDITDNEKFREQGFFAGKDRERVGLSDFIKDPEFHPLKTLSGKIEIASPDMVDLGGTLLPEHILIETTSRFPLRMVTPHEKYRIHSQFDNIPSMKKLCDDRLWINIFDAEGRGIHDNDPVIVSSDVGSVHVTAFVTDKISKGTVSMNQGAWPQSANNLTSTVPTLPSNGARTHSIVVNVERH